MPYYQILKQRRLDLNLSIQDVAIQTRLRPEYVRAIEENNLDIFSDDYSYVRYFVHGYCDAIGVNWNMIKDEVDANISACAAARDRALYQAQVKMMQSMQTVKPTKQAVRKTKKKRKKSVLKRSAGKVSRQMSWGNQNRLSRLILICAGCAVLLLAGTNLLARNAAKNSMAEQKIARQKELQQQEETTQRLADDLKNLKGGSTESTQEAPASSLSIAKTDKAGVYTVSGFQTGTSQIHFEITPAQAQDVTILWNDQPAFSQKVRGTAQYDLNAGSDGTATVIFSIASDKNQLTIDGLAVPAEYLSTQSDGQTRLQFQIRYSAADASAQSLETASESASVHADETAIPDDSQPADSQPAQTQPDAVYDHQDGLTDPVQDTVQDPSSDLNYGYDGGYTEGTGEDLQQPAESPDLSGSDVILPDGYETIPDEVPAAADSSLPNQE